MDQEGKSRSRLKIVAEHVEFKPFKKNEDADSAAEGRADEAEADMDAVDSVESEAGETVEV